MKTRITIYDIKRLTVKTSPYFFTRKTMQFFHQTMKGFSVVKQADGRIRISQQMRDYTGKVMGLTVRYFNPINNELENN